MILGCKSRARRRTRSCFVEIATGFLGVGIAAVMLPLRSSSLIARLSGRRNVLALRLKFFPNHCSDSRHRVSLTDFRYRAAAFPWSIAPPKGTALRSTSSLNSETSSASSTTPDDTISNAGFSTDGLNPSQLSAVTHPVDSLVRVISGPGSGKTRVLTSRIVHLLTLEDDWRRREGWDGMSHNRRGGILAVTFTRKAAGEMQERIQSMVQGNQRLLSRVTLGTFHSICAKILRWNGGLINSLPVVQREALSLSANGTTVSNNLNGNFVIIDDGEQSRILRGCMEEAGVSIKDSTVRLGAIQSTMNEYKEALSQGNSQPFGNSGKGLKGLSMVQQMALTLYPLYREHMLSHNCVDFDDLIYYCRDLLLNHVDVRERLQSKWTHVLVDEFQDTSKSQLDLVKLWTSNSLMVVGDADQSIYSWRGAHAGSLSDFDKEFQSWGNVSTVFLMENYRSTSNIIMAAQKVISHRSHFEEATGADKLRRNMKPKRGKGPPPRIIRFKDSDEEGPFSLTYARKRFAMIRHFSFVSFLRQRDSS
jgi:superfamily I DNA/RNA helicase